MAKKVNYVFRLAGAIIKDKVGDNTVTVGVDIFKDLAGEEIAERFENYVRDAHIEDAFKRADKNFEDTCADDELKQAIHELPLAGSTTLTELARKLPKTYDSGKFLSALIKTLKTYWGNILNDGQIKQAANIYQNCLERSLAAAGQVLLAVYIKSERIEFKIDEVLRHLDSFGDNLNLLQSTANSTDKTVRDNFSIASHTQATRFSDAGLDIELVGLNKDELEFNAQLDQCKILIDTGSPNAANKLLNHIEQSMPGKNISYKVWFRLKTLQAGCAIAMRDDEKAAKLLEDAHRLDPTSAKAISNLALAHLIQGDFDNAIALSKHAIEIDPQESSAYPVWVTASARKQEFKDLQSLVKEDYFNRPDYLRALGLIFYDVGEYARAVEYLRLALTLDSTKRYTKLSLVMALITYENFNKQPYRYLYGEKIEVSNSIKEAENLVNELIIEAEKGDDLAFSLEAKALRGSIKGFNGDTAGAKNDCDDVLKQDPNQANALCNRMVIARIENDLDYILTLAKRVPDTVLANEVELVHIVASAHIQKNNFDQALALTDKYCGTYKQPADNYECMVIKAWALFASGKEKDARDLIAGLLNNSIDFVVTLEYAALFENLIGSINSAISYLEEMYEKADADRKRNIALKLASLYLQNRDTAKAIEWLDREKIDITENTTLAKGFIPALYANQQLERAYKYCQKIRENNIQEPSLLEIEAHIAEMLGDLQLAYKLDTQLVNIAPSDARHQVNRARLCMRNDQEAEATTILKSIDPETIQNPYILLQLSQMYMLVNEPQKALTTMYRARELGIDQSKVHEGYFSLFLQLEDEIKDLEPSEVVAETSVLLATEDQEQWISISNDKNINAKDWEFSPKSEIAQLLLERKEGASIDLDTDSFGKRTWVIKKIQSKYVRAFQDTLEEFNMRFPKSNSIRKIKVENEDMTPFLTKVAGMSTRVQQMLDLYKQGKFTIDQLSASIGHNRVDTFIGLIADEGAGPYASIGSPMDQQHQKNVIRRVNGITIDLSALLTCSHLGILELLRKRFSKIFVPQHLLDELNVILEERRLTLKKGYSTIGYNGNNFFFIEVPRGQIENSINQLLELKSFVQDNCVVTPISPKYADQIAQIANINRDDHLSSLATIIIANQTQIPIFADDAQLRSIAQGFMKVPGFWSQILLEDLKARQIINSEGYVDACIKLLLAGYRYTAVNLEVISQTLEKYKFETNRYTLAVINALRGPETIEDNAINMAALVIDALWIGQIPIELKFNMLNNFLWALTAGRVSDIVLIKLMQKIKPGLNGYEYNEIIKQIRLWAAIDREVRKN